MEVHRLQPEGIVLWRIDQNQTKRIIHMICKYKARTHEQYYNKMQVNQTFCENLLGQIKKNAPYGTVYLNDDTAALFFYDIISSYKDEETQFTRSLVAQVHNAIPSPIDSLLPQL